MKKAKIESMMFHEVCSVLVAIFFGTFCILIDHPIQNLFIYRQVAQIQTSKTAVQCPVCLCLSLAAIHRSKGEIIY